MSDFNNLEHKGFDIKTFFCHSCWFG